MTTARLTVFALSFSLALGPSAAQAQTVLDLPMPGVMLPVTAAFTPAHITGVTVHPENPLEFDFIVAKGDSDLDGTAFAEESRKLIKYFLASLTVPEEEMWVNLSPYEKDRIIPAGFGQTEMGRDMLAQDYLLKQLTASLMYPEEELGKKFWDNVYKRAKEEFGTREVPVNTFNKVWIVPENAVVYEHGQTAYVVQARLRVMLDSDYETMQNTKRMEEGREKIEEKLSDQYRSSNLDLQSSIIKEVILPEIEREVNTGETFANLRQIYHSLILAAWYKKKLLGDENGRRSLLGQLYVDKNKTAGVDVDDPEVNRKIYTQYLEAFQKGVYNYIREDLDPATEEVIPRKYFSGGISTVGMVNGTAFRLADKLVVQNSLPATTASAIGNAAKESAKVTVKLVEETGNNERILKNVSSPINAVLPRADPTKTAAWSKLRDLAATKKYDLRDLFDADPDRAQRLSVALDEAFKVDFSKNLIDRETLAVLHELAQETQLTRAIEQMFTGEKINETENRAVLHTALRNVTRDANGGLIAANGPVYADGEDVMPEVIAVLNKMEAFTKKVRSGEWKGATGKRIRHVVNVGIGGSDLGPKMAAEALKAYGRDSGITAHFVSNVDGTAVAELIRELGNPEETLIVIESKTFTTQETIQNALTLKNWVVAYYQEKAGVSTDDAIQKHFVAVSTARDLVEAFGIDPQNMFAFWDWVGGRYSMWSAIGLTLATFIGFDNFLQMLEGAREADEHFRKQPLDQNIPVLKALLGVWDRNFLNAETYAILPYDQYLSLLPAFLQQGFMESQGKGTDRDGNFITDYHTGQILFGAAGTDGQHSFYQLIHQSPSVVPADFIGIARTKNPLPGHHEKLYSNFVAQPYALAFGSRLEEVMKVLDDGVMSQDELRWLAAHRTFPGNKPTTSIFIDEMTPRALGQLISVYENQIMAEGVIYNIFSFDQWGVQLGKVVATKNVLDFLSGARPLSELDAVPYGDTIRDIVERFREKQPQPAAKALGKLSATKAVEPLIKLLGDSDPVVRRFAADALGNLGAIRAVDSLIKLLEDSDSEVRKSAAEALGKLGDTRAVEPLITLLGNSKSYVRRSAAYALGNLGDISAVDSLIKLLEDFDSEVRKSAAEALGNLGDIRAVDSLIKLLEDFDSEVRRSAAWTLGKLSASKEQMVDGYIKTLRSSYSDVRKSAAETLGKLGDTRAVEPLIKLLGDSYSDVRKSVAEALGKLGDTRAVEPLKTLLLGTSRTVEVEYGYLNVDLVPDIRIENNPEYSAIENALSKLRDKVKISHPSPATGDGKKEISSSPIKDARGDWARQLEDALGKRKGVWSKVRGALWKNGPSNMEVVNLINAVGREGEGGNAGKVLLKALDDKSFFVRANAIIALGNLQYTPAVAPVIAAVQKDIPDLPTNFLPIILPKVVRALWRLNASHEEMSRFHTFVERELATRAEVTRDSQAIRETRKVLASWGLPNGWQKPRAVRGKAGRASSPVAWMRDGDQLPSVADWDAIARVQEIAGRNFNLSKRGRGDLRYFLTGNKSFKSIEPLLFVQGRDSINAENRTAVFREKTGILIAAYAGARWNLREDEIRNIKTFIAENGKPEELKQKQFVEAFRGLLDVDRDAADKEAIALEARQFLLSIAATFPLKAASSAVVKDEGRAQAAHDVGGIDFNSGLLDLQIRRDGSGVPLPMPMQPIGEMKIDGFIPVIIHIAPAANLPVLLGLTPEDLDTQPSDGDTASEINPSLNAARLRDRGAIIRRLSKRRELPVHALRA